MTPLRMSKTELLKTFSNRQDDLNEFLDTYGDYDEYDIDDVCKFFEVYYCKDFQG
jgi:AAA+ ATPase superfamily predicted ATPase